MKKCSGMAGKWQVYFDGEEQELSRLEESMRRMDDADPSEIDADEYQEILSRIVELRELRDRR